MFVRRVAACFQFLSVGPLPGLLSSLQRRGSVRDIATAKLVMASTGRAAATLMDVPLALILPRLDSQSRYCLAAASAQLLRGVLQEWPSASYVACLPVPAAQVVLIDEEENDDDDERRAAAAVSMVARVLEAQPAAWVTLRPALHLPQRVQFFLPALTSAGPALTRLVLQRAVLDGGWLVPEALCMVTPNLEELHIALCVPGEQGPGPAAPPELPRLRDLSITQLCGERTGPLAVPALPALTALRLDRISTHQVLGAFAASPAAPRLRTLCMSSFGWLYDAEMAQHVAAFSGVTRLRVEVDSEDGFRGGGVACWWPPAWAEPELQLPRVLRDLSLPTVSLETAWHSPPDGMVAGDVLRRLTALTRLQVLSAREYDGGKMPPNLQELELGTFTAGAAAKVRAHRVVVTRKFTLDAPLGDEARAGELLVLRPRCVLSVVGQAWLPSCTWPFRRYPQPELELDRMDADLLRRMSRALGALPHVRKLSVPWPGRAEAWRALGGLVAPGQLRVLRGGGVLPGGEPVFEAGLAALILALVARPCLLQGCFRSLYDHPAMLGHLDD